MKHVKKLDQVFGVETCKGRRRTECWPWKSESEQFLHKSASDLAFKKDENGDNDNISFTFGADLHAVLSMVHKTGKIIQRLSLYDLVFFSEW